MIYKNENKKCYIRIKEKKMLYKDKRKKVLY